MLKKKQYQFTAELENKCIRERADWTLIKQVKDNPRINIPVFGNGDVDSPEKAKLMRDEFGLDGGYDWEKPRLEIHGFLMK